MLKLASTFLFSSLLALPALAPALAQQLPLTELQMQRNSFMSAFAQCDSASIALQQQLKAVQDQVKALTDKYEPKSDQGQAIPK